MGLTIHYRGSLRSLDQLPELGRILERHARSWGVELTGVDEADDELFHFKDGAAVEYHGPVKGFILQPHAKCESLLFLFDKDGYAAHGCKTQYAPVDIHMEIVHLLEELEPLFATFTVHDEGGYWGTHDETELFRRINFLAKAIDRVVGILKNEEPHAQEPSGHELN